MSTGDPVARYRRWRRAAERAGAALPEAVALATATPDGRPSVRFVLVKGADARGFVFFTDTRSRKGRELAANPRAAFTVHWAETRRAVRVEGRVEPVTAEEADAYWATRPRGSQLAAAASRQSRRLAGRAALLTRVAALRRRLGRGPVPRPPWWSGYRIVPEAVEFWAARADRLHHRERFERTARGWRCILLEP